MTLFISACIVALPLWLIVAALRDVAYELHRIEAKVLQMWFDLAAVNTRRSEPMSDFPTLVACLLMDEHGKTKTEAEALVKKHPGIVMQGIMAGLTYVSARATATAILLLESPEE